MNLLRDALYPNGLDPSRIDFIKAWKLSQAWHITLASTVLGLVYPIFGDGFLKVTPFINGFLIGLFGGLSISCVELFVFPKLNRRFSLLSFVLAKTITYASVISGFVFVIILVSRSFEFNMSVSDTYHSALFQHFIFAEDFFIIIAYSLVFVLTVIFTREMNIKLGHGALYNFITGRYKSPRHEKLLFMFIDLDSSVTTAEKLGDLGFHNLLNDFFFDITNPVLMSHGTIYQYVGDQVVVTWPLSNDKNADECLRAYLSCHNTVNSARDRYLRKYGVVPSFKTAIHAGEVICAEIGSVKSAIVYQGDVLNTTARLERMCSHLGEDLLISNEVFHLLSENVKKCFEQTEPLQLKGKTKHLDVFQIQKKNPHPIEETALRGVRDSHPGVFYAHCA